MQKNYTLIMLTMLLVSCMHNLPSNAIEELGEQVIKKKEGIDIRLTPIEETKPMRDKTSC